MNWLCKISQSPNFQSFYQVGTDVTYSLLPGMPEVTSRIIKVSPDILTVLHAEPGSNVARELNIHPNQIINPKPPSATTPEQGKGVWDYQPGAKRIKIPPGWKSNFSKDSPKPLIDSKDEYHPSNVKNPKNKPVVVPLNWNFQ